MSLAGEWTVWLDPGNVGVAQGWAEDLSAGRTPAGAPSPPVALAVPGPLEGSPSTRGYDGVAFFVREFSVPDDARHALLALRFGQVNWACRAWLDGAEIGAHEGGYDAFDLQLAGGAVPGVHRLVLRVVDPGATPVDGVTLKTTPHSKESWYENFGGLVGPVSLRIDRSARLTGAVVRVDDAASAVSLRGSVELSPSLIADGQLRIALEIAVDGVVRLRRDVPVHEGSADFDERIELPGATRWSPERPELHRVRVSVEDGRGRRDELLARDVGLRTVELRGGDLLVDGQRRVLKGVLWQPFFTGTGGVTPPDEELAAEARAIADTGFNLVRAHVRPAPPAFLDACDRLGLLVLEEPAIGWVDDDPALLPRLQHELDWMVARDGHHPSIILWGVLNELSGKAYRYADALVEHLAALDDSRPILEDSGGFFGDGRMLPPRAPAARLLPMVDRHAYPPYPLALEDRDELVHLGEGGDRPVFVSEFGYGTLTDCVTALAGFERRAP
ncbi:MAG TPA: glycoside hydrolase family 2 TIM barrel-domain containing protein, partial [Planctomycetota bacterium]|nr:glycoside hydrolase family 2 TIM barrel-domain containing protein [Planctomycetota bacterium]